MDGSPVIWKVVHFLDFVTPMDGILVIMEGSLLSIFLLFQWMVALSLWNVVCCWDFVSQMYGSLVIMEGSSLLRFCYSYG